MKFSVHCKKDNIYINVPYVEKDQAKKLGARWDPSKKSWFITKRLNPNHFEKWIQKEPVKRIEVNIRSEGFYIAESFEQCWNCLNETPIFAFLLPDHHHVKEYEDEDDLENNITFWQTANYKSMLSYVGSLNQTSLSALQNLSTCYFIDYSNQADAS